MQSRSFIDSANLPEQSSIVLRLLIFFLPVMAAGSELAAGESLIADFESDRDYGDWQVEGDAFGMRPAAGTLDRQMAVSGFDGERLANSYHQGDSSTGTLTSSPFEITRDYLSFLIGGGELPGEVGVELLIDGEMQRSATGHDSETLRRHSWNVSEFRGKQARMRAFDRAAGGWGHILLDQVLLTDESWQRPDVGRLEHYRKSEHYYRERFRPQFHFTPEINWINDPNGLVYFDGEYHLFFQHNPHGAEWGHMSWGHAVSSDLLHWSHLPIALHEEYGVMAFSGSAVFDAANTSGLGTDENPPLVAIYTGHGHGRQTKDIAHSTDRGRTWTKYAGNPVLDIDENNFRDPKVFWHADSRKWVMVVSLAAAKRIQFYGSPNLKDWTLLSEFGPAGVKDKPNWECPDLFKLPIENEPDTSRWVLEADMGGGAIAGGSGGEYFTGTFDGIRFVPDSPNSHWVDYGRDFYAPVSWSNMPESDGRRIWIGWMNNWQTSLNPTYPWRGAMSIPRQLSLRRVSGELRLCQQPVREVATLRREAETLTDLTLTDEVWPLEPGGRQLDILLELEPKSAETCGIRVLANETHFTEIGYDSNAKAVYVDRTQAADQAFHPEFPGRHSGPLLPDSDGRVRLRILVDACSVEVFAGDGQTVITDLVFPDGSADAVALFATGGSCRVVSCTLHQLASVWHDPPRQ